MSTAELRAVARRDGIYGYDTLCKEDLLQELYELDLYSGFYCTMIQLRDDARSRGLSGYSEMCKVDLIELLNNDDYNNRLSWLGFQDKYRPISRDSFGGIWVHHDYDDDKFSIGSLIDSDFEDKDEEDLIFL